MTGPSGAQVLVFRASTLLTVAILASVPAYAVAAWLLLRRHRSQTLERHSEPRGRDLSWLRWIVLALLAVWTMVIATAIVDRLAPHADTSGLRHSMMAGVTLFIYLIGCFGVRQFAVAEPEEPSRAATPAVSSAKYALYGPGKQ